MIKIENVEVVGLEHAIRGMRNPMNSWDKSDSYFGFYYDHPDDCEPEWRNVIGPNDDKLMTNLANAGRDHAKYRRMIVVYLDITAPLYWWKEFDTYKVGTVANSCSTMHKIHDKEFTVEDFSCEHLIDDDYYLLDDELTKEFKEVRGYLNSPIDDLLYDIEKLNLYRKMYLKTKVKKWWWLMIQRLPSNYNQKRTIMLNYEVLANIFHSRRFHKLDEWRELCKWILTLPQSHIITGKLEDKNDEN